jgi:tellurite resistance-related uncharacterized protein
VYNVAEVKLDPTSTTLPATWHATISQADTWSNLTILVGNVAHNILVQNNMSTEILIQGPPEHYC